MLSRSRITIDVLRSVLNSTVRKSPRFGLQLPSRIGVISQLRIVPAITARGYANGPGGPRGPVPPGGTHRMDLGGGEYH